jgi:hypothetical protein
MPVWTNNSRKRIVIMKPAHHIPRQCKLATAVLVAISLTACGGGGGGSSGDATTSTGASATGTPTSGAGTAATGSAGSGGMQALPCATYLTTGFNGDLNAVYSDGWGGVPQTGTCSGQGRAPADGGGVGGGDGAGGSGGSGGGDGGAGGSGGSGGGDGGAGAGGGEGMVLNALMTVTRLSDGAVLGSALTDSVRGLVTIRPRAADGPVLLTLTGRTGAKYYDEGTGQFVDFGPDQVLHALVDRFDENIGVSPLTEAAYRYALNNVGTVRADVMSGKSKLATAGDLRGLTVDQVDEANETARAAINTTLPPALQLVSVKSLPTPVDNSSGETALPVNRYGIAETVIGGLVKAAAARRPDKKQPALGLTEQVARDLTDGTLDGMTLDQAQAAPASATYYDAKTLPGALGKGTAAMANRFGKGTTSNIAPAVSTKDESDFAGPWQATAATEPTATAGSAPSNDNADTGSIAVTVDSTGTATGVVNGLGAQGASAPVTGKVENDGTITLSSPAQSLTFTGAVQSDGSFVGTWKDDHGSKGGAWESGKGPGGAAPAKPKPKENPPPNAAGTPAATAPGRQ